MVKEKLRALGKGRGSNSAHNLQRSKHCYVEGGFSATDNKGNLLMYFASFPDLLSPPLPIPSRAGTDSKNRTSIPKIEHLLCFVQSNVANYRKLSGRLIVSHT
jgi:hypothetical protein